MELRISHEPGYILVSTPGRIDESGEDAFREHLHPLVAQRNARMVLDLSQSGFVTSRGIGELVSLVVHANSCGSRVVLAACQPYVRMVFETARLDKFFELAATVSEAVEAVASPRS